MIPKKLYHYSNREIKTLQKRVYCYRIGSELIKPVGLWFAVEDFEEDVNWKDFCVREEFRVKYLRCKHLITLVSDAGILYISDSSSLDALHYKYYTGYGMIDWNKIARIYQGIIIAPYIYDRRNSHATWYYGWDCASGCIWDLRCIKSFELVEKIKIPRKKR